MWFDYTRGNEPYSFIHSFIPSVSQSVIPVYCWHRTPYYQETRDLKTTRGHLVEPAETPVLWIVPFAWKWTRPFWQKWTCPRGHRAGLWPSWLAGLLASRCWHETDIETAGQTKRKHNVPDLGYDAQSLRGVKSHTGMHLIDMIAPKYIKIQHKLELKANCICPEVMLGRCREKIEGFTVADFGINTKQSRYNKYNINVVTFPKIKTKQEYSHCNKKLASNLAFPEGTTWGGSECGNRISSADFYIVF